MLKNHVLVFFRSRIEADLDNANSSADDMTLERFRKTTGVSSAFILYHWLGVAAGNSPED